MKRVFLHVLLVAVLLLQAVSAVDLSVTKTSSDEVMIRELQNPVTFDLEIENLGKTDTFKIYNLLGFITSPDKITIVSRETEELSVSFSYAGEFKKQGPYILTCYFMGSDGSEQKQELLFKVVDLENVFEVKTESLNPDSNVVKVIVQNKVDYDFEKVDAVFKSAFFTFEKSFAIGPYQSKEFTVELNREDMGKLLAGFYTLDTKLNVEGNEFEVESNIQFEEKESVVETRNDDGLIINTETIRKENQGNLIAYSVITLDKNIISRVFTTLSPEPTIVDRQGFKIYYTWKEELNPGENLEIKVRTNWLMPLGVVFLVVVIVIFAKRYSETDLALRKKISFVRAKGGEFALKISIIVHSRTYVEKITVMDRLPPLVKLYERFGTEHPSRVNEKSRKIEWEFERLDAGETRVLSYLVYSKVGVLGKFALPSATAIYEKNGKVKETTSNRAFFVSETRGKEDFSEE